MYSVTFKKLENMNSFDSSNRTDYNIGRGFCGPEEKAQCLVLKSLTCKSRCKTFFKSNLHWAPIASASSMSSCVIYYSRHPAKQAYETNQFHSTIEEIHVYPCLPTALHTCLALSTHMGVLGRGDTQEHYHIISN